MKLLIIVAIVWVVCILRSLYWYIKCVYLYKQFSNGKQITSRIVEINELFHVAGTSYETIYDINRGGYRQRLKRDVAYLADSEKNSTEINKVFLLTKGVFRLRLIRSIFPIYVVFLPSYIFKRNNVAIPAVLHGLITVCYWLIDAFLGYNLNIALDYLYRSRFLEWLRVLIEETA